MYGFDFKATAERLQSLAKAVEGGQAEGGVGAAVFELENELAIQSVLYLYDHLVKRDQWASAAHLLAWGLPSTVSRDSRIMALLRHAARLADAKFSTYEQELIRAREGVLEIGDGATWSRAFTPPRFRYWKSVVSLRRSVANLEYGCGAGLNVLNLSMEFPELGAVYGVDINGQQVGTNRVLAAQLGNDRVLFGTPEETTTWHGRHGTVAVLDVLEHTVYPGSVLDAAERYVRAGGVVVVSVPGHLGVSRLATDGRFDYEKDPPGDLSHVNTTTLPGLVSFLRGRGNVLDAAVLPPTMPGEMISCVATYIPKAAG